VDLSLLTYESADKQRRSAESLAYAVKKLLSSLIAFPKVIIAAVNGTARGLGVTMLPFFDMVKFLKP
jgi:enoyl-CoA hydratase/carnithine racemase